MLSQKKSGKRWPPLRPRPDLHHVWVSGSYAAIRALHWCDAAIHKGTTPVWPYISTPHWCCGRYIRAPVQWWAGTQSRDDISLDLPPCPPITTVQWSSCWRLHGGTVGQAHTHIFSPTIGGEVHLILYQKSTFNKRHNLIIFQSNSNTSFNIFRLCIVVIILPLSHLCDVLLFTNFGGRMKWSRAFVLPFLPPICNRKHWNYSRHRNDYHNTSRAAAM